MSDLSDNDIDTMDEESDLGVGYEDDDSMDEGKLFANGHTGLEGGPGSFERQDGEIWLLGPRNVQGQVFTVETSGVASPCPVISLCFDRLVPRNHIAWQLTFSSSFGVSEGFADEYDDDEDISVSPIEPKGKGRMDFGEPWDVSYKVLSSEDIKKQQQKEIDQVSSITGASVRRIE